MNSESTYVNGRKNGISRYWYVNGQLKSECTYDNGDNETGISRHWYENG